MSEKNRCRHLSICSIKWAVNGPFVCALCSRFFVHRNRCELCRSMAHTVRTSIMYVITLSNCDLEVLISSIYQGFKNYGRQVFVATKFCTVAPSICEFSVWNLFHVTTLAFRFLEILCTPSLYPLYFSWGSNCFICTDLMIKSCHDWLKLKGSLMPWIAKRIWFVLPFFIDWRF